MSGSNTASACPCGAYEWDGAQNWWVYVDDDYYRMVQGYCHNCGAWLGDDGNCCPGMTPERWAALERLSATC